MWRMTILALVAGAFVIGWALPAEAAPRKRVEATEERLFDFEGDTVEADYLKPLTQVVDVATRKGRKSLITIRNDFVDEIVRSAENI